MYFHLGPAMVQINQKDKYAMKWRSWDCIAARPTVDKENWENIGSIFFFIFLGIPMDTHLDYGSTTDCIM